MAQDDAGYADMFAARCASCHGTCGQCHVSRPVSVRGGLIAGHTFLKTPSQTENCTACHGSRVGNEFRGKNPGIPADAHWRLEGMNCMACHEGMELHGDGTTPDDRFANDAGPTCTGCHPGTDSPDAELSWHSTHGGKLACQVCHSVQYKNCYSCHVEIEEQALRFPSEMDFRIGRNTDPSERRPYNYVVVRHVPIAPDTFEPWDLELADYAAVPTWRMATPHNIQKNTPQTESCDTCHGSLELFLTTDYLQELVERGVMTAEEIEANANVVVDEPPGMN
jgi:thiosulfate/3-mercaptopyruvate sulfurtransferase